MAAYVIVEIEVLDPSRYERYKQLAGPSVAAYGGKYIVRGGATSVLEGDWQPKRIVVLEFPSAEQAKAWWNSEEYKEGKALRQSIAHTRMIIAEGVS
jgi:uncharacterized protein (DUF1330 family)